MKVQVLLFGRPRDLAGRSQELVSINEDAELGDLFRFLGDKHGAQLACELGRTEGLIVMINGLHFGPLGGTKASLKDGDVVAIFPIAVGG